MMKRGSQLLEAHIRSFDPDEPTARERLDEALGEPFVRQLLLALCPTHRGVAPHEPDLPS